MRYVIIENEKVVNVVVSDAPLADNWILTNTANIGDGYINGEFIPKASQPEPEPEPETKITRLAFLNRFTDEEAIMIDLASIDDPTANLQTRSQAAAMRRFINKINAATYVDIARQDTITGIQTLVTFGILTSERAEEILSTTIQEDEIYRGQ